MAANKKISELTGSGALTGAELVPVVQEGVTLRTTTQAIADLAAGGGGTVSSFAFTNGGGFTGSVSNATTTPTLGLALDATGVTAGSYTFGSFTVNAAGQVTAASSGGLPDVPVDFKDSVDVATTANITLSGEQTIDGVLTSASRVLVKNQTTASQNGIYTTGAGAWTRTEDADASAEVTSGMLMFVSEGSANGGLIYTLTTPDPITLGTTALTFVAVLLPFSFFVGKTVAGTTYTHILTDSGKRLNFTNASTKTLTVAPQGTVNSAANTEIEVFNAGAGLLTIAPGSGVTINALGGVLTVPQYHAVKLKKRANPNTWDVTGIGSAGVTGTGSLVYSTGGTLVNPIVGTQSPGDNSTKAASTAYVDAAIAGSGAGSVSAFSFTDANGVDGTVTNATTTPNLTISLGAITPTSVAASGAVSGSNLSGTNTGDQTITLTGDVTGSGTGSFAATLATVNSNVGSFGSATQTTTFTVNGKGLLTAAGQVTVTPAVGSITGLGTGIATALAVNVGSAGAPVLFNGAGGAPSSLTLTNATGLPVAGGGTGVASLTAYAPIFGGTTSTGAVQSGTVGTAGQVLTSNGAGAIATMQSQPFDVHAFYPGLPTASAKVTRVPVGRAVAFAANFSGSYFSASANATASTVFDVQKNGSSIGTVTIGAGGTTATFATSGGSAQSLAAGDLFAIIAPATPDATLADPGFVLVGTR